VTGGTGEDDYRAKSGTKNALPSIGWRKVAARTFHLPVGKSEKEKEVDSRVSDIRRSLLNPKVVGFLGGKGGVGKTTTAAAIASMVAIHRPKSVCIVTLDYNSTLSLRTKSSTGAARPGINLKSFADPSIEGPQEVAACFDYNVHRLSVMGTGLNPLEPNALTSQQFREDIRKLKRDFDIVFIDFGNSPTDVYWEAIRALDVMVLVSSTESDSMAATRAVEGQIREVGMGDKVDTRTVSIINHRSSADPLADLDRYAQNNRGALQRREVVEIPWDSHLSESGPIDLDLVGKSTYRQLMLAAAVVMRTLPN